MQLRDGGKEGYVWKKEDPLARLLVLPCTLRSMANYHNPIQPGLFMARPFKKEDLGHPMRLS